MTCVLLLDMFFTAGDLARLWYADGALRCRVTDDGPGLTGTAIPAALPAPDFGEDGRGLWLARELSDRLDITGGAGGAIVTLERAVANVWRS
jgi:anti-sigma regulatory factor (Ser/Thr protein kinase)